MDLWQMDVVGRIHLADGTELHAVTGIDDHSASCVCARLVARATAKPVCDALAGACAPTAPDAILTDNGKVFTARLGKGPGPVLFDRICADNGIRHLLTAPHSPTTTGKVERFHKTLRAEWARPNDGAWATVAKAQASRDACVRHYNTERPHHSRRHGSAGRAVLAGGARPQRGRCGRPRACGGHAPARPPGVSRWVDQRGHISLAGFSYRVGPTFAGEAVEVVCHGELVEILHAGVVAAIHAQRFRSADPQAHRSGA